MFQRTLWGIALAVTTAAGSGLPYSYSGMPAEPADTGVSVPTERRGPDLGREGPADVIFHYTIVDITDAEKPAVTEELIPVLRIRAAGFTKIYEVERGSSLGDINVRLTDCPDPDRAREVLETPALLEFRAVADDVTLPELLADVGPIDLDFDVDERGYVRFPEAGREAFHIAADGVDLPAGRKVAYTRPAGGKVGALLITDDGMVVDEVRDAAFVEDPVAGPIVTFDMDLAGRREFAGLTARHVGGELAIIFDGYILYKGQVAERVEGIANIENVSTREEAEDIALLLRSGSLPARLNLTAWYVNGVEMKLPQE